jgi:hypothetical protein
MIFELRQYRIKNGQRDNWVRLMETEIIPFQVSHGMVVVGSFVGEEEPDLYVWLRRFESEEERVRQYHDVYQSERWLEAIKPQIDLMLDRETMQVTRLIPTAKSVLR